jgi:hypothetical protein
VPTEEILGVTHPTAAGRSRNDQRRGHVSHGAA